MHCNVGCEQKWVLDIDMDSGVGIPGRTWDMCTDRQLQARQLLVLVITLGIIICMSEIVM